MPVITLISDRNIDDFFLGRLKGQLLKACDNLNIVDLAHNIGHHSISKAAFILKNSYRNFPDGTVHLIGVDGECSGNRSHLIAKVQDQYFIAADNGLFSLVFESDEFETIIKIDGCDKSAFKTPALFVFGKIACEIINGVNPENLGKVTGKIKQMLALHPSHGENYILGNIIYMDSYSNAVSNITYDIFNEIAQGRPYRIYAGTSGYAINNVSYSYQDVEPGELVAVFNSLGLLEIAMNKGEISKLLSFSNTTKIRIEFYDSKNS
ncbi:MAG: SAM-dependent chlorinase/fluorinase [Bacteroidales bacterium]|nr:SAM-dependent chlorinase/fluorinase [Bacteroidales bacterium]